MYYSKFLLRKKKETCYIEFNIPNMNVISLKIHQTYQFKKYCRL